MADNLTKTITKARALAVCHVIVGFLLVCFGIAGRVLGSYTGILYLGISTGIWVSRIGGSSNVDFCFVLRAHKYIYRRHVKERFYFQCGFRYLEYGSITMVRAPQKYSVEATRCS